MLKPKQLTCLEMLTSGHSRVEISKKLNISESTIQRWQKLPEFKDALEGVAFSPVAVTSIEVTSSHRTRRERLERLLDSSIDVLEEIVKNEESRTSDKIRAIQLIGDWVGIGKLPDYEAALMVLEEMGWLPSDVVESARDGAIEFKEKVRKALSA